MRAKSANGSKLHLPKDIAAQKTTVYNACGDSFEDEAIYDGDYLICRERFEKSEVTEGSLVIVAINAEINLKRISYLIPGKVMLSSSNHRRNYSPLVMEPHQVEIIALVIGRYSNLK